MTPSRIGLKVVDGLIAELPEVLLADEEILSPGFIDVQINGSWGHDFTLDPNSIWEVGTRLPETGVTSFLPTIVSAPYEMIDRAIEAVAMGPPAGYRGAAVLGLHLEGPWISPEWRGAHHPSHLQLPDSARAAQWAESGVIRMVTMAPELDGAEETARVLADSGVTVSLGHSGADYETAARALSGSWSAVTHLFNQMSPFHHRSPGVVLAALLSDAPCGLIADGLHNHPDTIRMAWTQLGPERTVLVTDAVAAMGMPQGSYRLGESPVTLGPDGPRTEQGTLAGSELTMAGAVANLASWTSSTIEEALVSASSTPARLAGKEDRGRLQPGARADFVFLDRQMRVVETVVGGETLYKAKERG